MLTETEVKLLQNRVDDPNTDYKERKFIIEWLLKQIRDVEVLRVEITDKVSKQNPSSSVIIAGRVITMMRN